MRAVRLSCACAGSPRTTPGGAHGIERSAEVRRSLATPDAERNRLALLELMHSTEWLAGHPGPYWTSATRPCPRTPAVTTCAPAPSTTPERIPDARLELLPGARHAYFEECRGTAGRLVREFLT